MMDTTKTYRAGTVFQLLLRGKEASSVVDEWFSMNRACDLRVRHAKTDGCVVIECTDMIFAAHVIQWWPGTKVNVKEPAAYASGVVAKVAR